MESRLPGGLRPAVRQQFFKVFYRMFRNASEHIAEPGKRIDPGQFTRGNKAAKDCRGLPAVIAAEEGPVVTAEEFGGDRGAADWRHFGRLSGYTNRKAKYLSDGGLFPFVRLTEASGAAYAEGERFIAAVSDRHELDLRAREHRRCAGTEFRSSSKGIEDFRANPRYGGDAT